MMQAINQWLGLGLEPRVLDFLQLLLRAAVVFVGTLLMIRLGGRRFLAQRNSFDVLLGFILASTLARAINGSAPFFGTLGVGLFVVGLHRLLSYGAYRFHLLGVCLKGQAEQLISDGQPDARVMARHHVSQHDLEADLRLNAAVSDPAQVNAAHLERNGEISVQRKPQVVNISVSAGVQTVKVLLEG